MHHTYYNYSVCTAMCKPQHTIQFFLKIILLTIMLWKSIADYSVL